MTSHQNLSVLIHTHTSTPELAPLHTFNTGRAHCQLLKCKQSGWIFRSLRGLEYSRSPDQAVEVLGYIQKRSEGCTVTPCKNLGLLLAHPGATLANSSHQLAVGDEVRLGRMALIVRQIQDAQNAARGIVEGLDAGRTDTFPLDSCKDLSIAKGQTCRVCLEETDDELVSPCNCCGSIGAIHIKCLQRWIHTKLIIRRSRKVLSFVWQNYCCELCGEEYPDRLVVNGRVHHLLKLPQLRGDHVALEVKDLVHRDKVVLFAFSSKQVILGSALYADIRLKDVSVSRRHALIKWNATGPYIEECGSEFGTCVMLTEPVFVGLKQSLALQAGPTVMIVQVKKKWSLSCLLCGSS